MKKLNKKGFTLIELLAVLVILSIIMAIALPNITSSVERNKEKQKQLKIELVKSAAEVYADSHKTSIKSIVVDDCINIKSLIEKGALTLEEAKDPTNEKYTLCGCVTYPGFGWQDHLNSADQESYRIIISE